MVAALAAATVLAAPAPLPPRIEAGRSVEGRRIVAVRTGPADAPVRVLVSGSTHGTEPAGHAVIARLREADPRAVQVWTVRTFNPDGVVRGTRQNARGVDLNRNLPSRWRGGGRPWDTYFPGPEAASEPETRAEMGLIRRIRPQLTVHYHQHMRLVNLTGANDKGLVRAYARRAGLPARRLPPYRGTASGWQNRTFPGSTAFVVELPAGRLSAAGARRHADAVLRTAAASAAAAQVKPEIRWSPIPFEGDRIRQTRAYARRHYGLDRARLIEPKAIVQHYTASSSFGSAFNTFAANAPDVEFGERPGVCAHFIVDRDGTIHQLVRLRWMCRHTVGLNHVAFGIEHVGTSDGDVMGRTRQLRASLRLTRWLQARHGIATKDVIGHAESLSSPYHREKVAAMRNRTHGDMSRTTMKRYRKML